MSIDTVLAEYHDNDYTVRLVNAVFKVVPFAPTLKPYKSIDDAVYALQPGAGADVFARARQEAQQKDLQDVMWMANLVDTGDKGYAVFTGLKSIWNLARGNENPLETDDQQRNDAALKAVALAYMAWNAVPGGVADRAEAFRALPSGQALALYWAAIEVALPFADNLATAGGGFVDKLLGEDTTKQAARLTQMAGGKSMDGAVTMLESITSGLHRIALHAGKYAKPIADTAQHYAPGALGAADKVAGLAANAADVMPVYRWLGARLAAEAAVWRATH